MDRRRWIPGWPRRLLAPIVGVMVVLAAALPAHARSRPQPVTGWIRHNAAPLETVDPTAPLHDVASLRRSIGDAEIVGLGQSTHGAAEELTLKHRALRLLVERLGFRSVAWEEDWTTGLRINEYIQTGKGDLDTLMGQMSPQWQSRQVADVLAWLRDYNADHADKTSHAALVSSGCGRSVGGAV
jgi:erythromycin esterase-like protein